MFYKPDVLPVKKLKRTCISFESRKYSEMSKCWLNNDCTHSRSADLLRGKPVYRLRYKFCCVCTKFIQLIRRKIVKIVVIRCHVLKLKCTSAPYDRLAGFNGSYF